MPPDAAVTTETETQRSIYCRRCGYDLRALPERRCPECGQRFDPARPRSCARRPWAHLTRRWSLRLAALLLLALATGAAGLAWIYAGWRTEPSAIASIVGSLCDVRANRGSVTVRRVGPARLARLLGPRAYWLDRADTVIVNGPGWDDHNLAATVARLRFTRDLTLTDTRITSAGMKRLAALRDLQRLDLSDNRLLTGDALAALGKLDRLEELSLYNYYGVLADPPLGQFHALRKLDIFSVPMSPAAMAGVGSLSNLQTLTLSNCDLTPDAVAPLASLTHLQELRLNGNWELNDDALAPLATLTALKHLEMSLTPLKGPGLVHLTPMTRLRFLDIHMTLLTDDAMPHLEQLTALRHLSLCYTKTSTPAVDRLRKKLPKTMITNF